MTLARDCHISTQREILISDIAAGDLVIDFISLLLLQLPESVTSHHVFSSINWFIHL